MTPEGHVKLYLKKECEARGWDCLPLVDPTRRAWPDRTILPGGGRVAFCEVKAVGIRHPKAHLRRQKNRIAELLAKGNIARMVTGNDEIDEYIRYLEEVWSHDGQE